MDNELREGVEINFILRRYDLDATFHEWLLLPRKSMMALVVSYFPVTSKSYGSVSGVLFIHLAPRRPT